jgi:hypothetical protein
MANLLKVGDTIFDKFIIIKPLIEPSGQLHRRQFLPPLQFQELDFPAIYSGISQAQLEIDPHIFFYRQVNFYLDKQNGDIYISCGVRV